jgi:hypothetical protein
VGIIEDVRASAERIAVALTSSGYRADFSPASLWQVDRFFDEQAPGGQPRARGLLAAQLGARLFGMGSYVGEVIRRDIGGDWHGDDTDPAAEVNVALRLPDGSVIWPVQRVMKRFRDGAGESVAAYGSVLGLHVGAPPPPRRWFRGRR